MNVVVRPGPLLSALRVSGVAHMSYIHYSERLLLLPLRWLAPLPAAD